MKKLYIGIIGSVLCAVSDILLLYHPQLFIKYTNYQFLFEINSLNNTLGWLIGMACIPLLFLGYKGVREIADKESQSAMEKADWVVIFLISFGCVVHTVYHFVPLFHTTPQLNNVEIISIKLIETLFTLCYMIYCIIITLQSFKPKNKLLYANRYFNPLIWMLLVTVLTIINQKYGAYLAVSAFNLSIGFYFSGILWNTKKIKQK